MVHVLSLTLFGQALGLAEFPHRPDLTGVGLSDWGYDAGLAAKLGYRNTFFDEEPQLDITDPPRELEGTLDFLIASDVFEHVPPPVERAFDGAFRLLKPGGAFIITVPVLLDGDTMEHFPGLHDYALADFNGSRILVNRTAAGTWEVFDDLRYHRGPGFAVEMRIFSYSSLMRNLREAGFDDITDWMGRQSEFPGGWRSATGSPLLLVGLLNSRPATVRSARAMVA